MTAIGNTTATEYGIMSRLINDNAAIRQRFDTLTSQASSGLVGDTYAALGDGASVSLGLSPQVAQLQNWQSNIDTATNRMQVTQAAMTQMQQIASDLLSQLNNLNGLNASNIDAIAATARTSMQQVAGLLDTQDGTVYVFAGADVTNPPVPNPDGITSGGFFAGISAAVQSLSANGATATASATLAIASSDAAGVTPFSAGLTGTPAPIIQTGAHTTATVGIVANANLAAVSTGSSTTGSYSRDLLRALATIGSLSSGQATDTDLPGLVQDVRQSLTGAISSMATDAGVLGDTQSSLSNMKTQLNDMATALTSQISSAQDVDMAATLSSLSQVQTQLQASYQLIAGMTGLSLAKFLPA
jgi:flagellar hook-associated protein 3 FlgL